MKRTICLSVLFFLLFIIHVPPAQSDSQKAVSDWDKVVTEAREGGYELITPDEIEQEYLKYPDALFLVDTRQDWAYQMQHIKGAVYLPVTPTWWYQYSPAARSEMKKVLGPDKNKKVIFY
jgi:hypothetical protein